MLDGIFEMVFLLSVVENRQEYNILYYYPIIEQSALDSSK